MTTYHWPDLRAQAIEHFNGQTPGPQLEQDIIDIFEQHPQTVAAAITRIAGRYRTGTITSPWGVLRADLQRATTSPDITATDSTDRDKSIAVAEQWIRTAGCHYDRPSEIEHELFGDARIHPTVDPRTGEAIVSPTDGLLTPWAHDLNLRQRILQLWEHERPRGEQAEADHQARADRWVREQAARTPRPHPQTPSAQEPAPPDKTTPEPEPDPEPDVFATQGAPT